LEAMACGVPVIGGLHTGMLEYMTEANTLHVPSDEMIEAPSYEYRFKEPAMMRSCDSNAVIHRLRWANDNRDALLALGQKAASDVASLTWEKAGEEALARLREYRSAELLAA